MSTRTENTDRILLLHGWAVDGRGKLVYIGKRLPRPQEPKPAIETEQAT